MQEKSSLFDAARRGDEQGLIQQHLRTYYRLGGRRKGLPAIAAPGEQRVHKIGLLMVASGGYARFFKPHVLSADKYLFRGLGEVH